MIIFRDSLWQEFPCQKGTYLPDRVQNITRPARPSSASRAEIPCAHTLLDQSLLVLVRSFASRPASVTRPSCESIALIYGCVCFLPPSKFDRPQSRLPPFPCARGLLSTAPFSLSFKFAIGCPMTELFHHNIVFMTGYDSLHSTTILFERCYQVGTINRLSFSGSILPTTRLIALDIYVLNSGQVLVIMFK